MSIRIMNEVIEAAPVEQKDRVYCAFDKLRRELDASGSDTLIVLTSEHWANFFLDHIGAFCIGKAETYSGPIEPWLKIEKQQIKGDPQLAAELILDVVAILLRLFAADGRIPAGLLRLNDSHWLTIFANQHIVAELVSRIGGSGF